MTVDEETGEPLLGSTSLIESVHGNEEEIVPHASSNGQDEPAPSLPETNRRLESLDVFRGLTVALMILVDDAGGAFPSINHAPWFGVTLADFVMPFFLYGVGVSIGLVFKKPSNKQLATKKVILRTVKLFVLGLLLQDWEFEAPSMNLSAYGSVTQIVHCGIRGSLDPPCNAVGFVDRYILGKYHLYQHPVYRRTKECSVNSPDYGPLPTDSPEWCLAPFDPEGILSSMLAAVTCFVGLHFGHVLVHFKGDIQRVLLWSLSSFLLLISGFVLRLLGIPFSKPLYTLSYMCITAGASGLLLTVIFYMVDVKHFGRTTILLKWMGLNALIIYALGACELFPAVVQGFYWHSPENNLVDFTESFLQAALNSRNWGTLVFVLLEILFWGLFAGFLHMKGIYIKL